MLISVVKLDITTLLELHSKDHLRICSFSSSAGFIFQLWKFLLVFDKVVVISLGE